MAQYTLGNEDNVQIAHAVSCHIQPNWTGAYRDVGFAQISGITLAPEFKSHMINRYGQLSEGKKVLTKKSASVNLKLEEPTILNIARVIYGGAIAVPGDAGGLDAATVYDSRLMTLSVAGAVVTLDFTDVTENTQCDYEDIVVVGVYKITDATYAENLITSNKAVASNGTCTLSTDLLATTYSLANGDSVCVAYTFPIDDCYSCQIFGASNATLSGAAQLQVRNISGGVVQLWSFASVSFAPNGEIGFPTDDFQNIPMTMALLERGGTYGRVYTK